ncbi:MAG: hypothetical protein ACYDEA_12640 [Candidatus Dormibacteria bacterium]
MEGSRRAHIVLCWLALLPIRVAENRTQGTWRNLRHELQRLHLGVFQGSACRCLQRTEITSRRAEILKSMEMPEPPRFLPLEANVRSAARLTGEPAQALHVPVGPCAFPASSGRFLPRLVTRAAEPRYHAPSKAECGPRRAQYCSQLRAQAQGDAADCLERNWEDFVTFWDFPDEHLVHLRTSNPTESICAGVRVRTNATTRERSREKAPYLVFKLVLRLSTKWRPINGRDQLTLLGPPANTSATDGCAELPRPPWRARPLAQLTRLPGGNFHKT